MHFGKVIRFFWLALLACIFTSAHAQPEIALIPSAPQIAAKSFILMDADSGSVILEGNANQRLPPASLTKMMTAYIVEYEMARGNIKEADEVLVSVNAWRTGGSKMFIREGNRVPLSDLLKGVIIQSGNDASIALAEHIAGGERAFADIMNQHSQLLGMTNTHFVNATGMPAAEHLTTARDLALLAQAIIRDYPDQYAMYSEKYFTYNNIRQPNRNLLLWRDKSVDGLKTGHTEEAGYCLVASAKRDGMRLISVVMGTVSEEARAKETQKLLNYGFRFYETHKLYDAGQSLMDAKVWLGSRDKANLGAARDVVVTVPRGQKDKLEAVLDVSRVIKAPLSAGQELGRIKVTLAGEPVLDQPLIALEDVEEGGFFKRLWDMIKLFFVNLFS